MPYVEHRKNARFYFLAIYIYMYENGSLYLVNNTFMNFNNLVICPKITKICGMPLNIIPWLHTKFGSIWMMFE